MAVAAVVTCWRVVTAPSGRPLDLEDGRERTLGWGSSARRRRRDGWSAWSGGKSLESAHRIYQNLALEGLEWQWRNVQSSKIAKDIIERMCTTKV